MHTLASIHDWLILTTNLNVIGLLNWCSSNKLSDSSLVSELVENRNFFFPVTIREIVIFLKNKNIRARKVVEFHFARWASNP